MSTARFVYTSLLFLLLPFLPLRLLWRGRKQADYLAHWRERFGFYATDVKQPVIWLHAVSVGETRAALPLVRQLQSRYPDHHLLITHMTPTGRQTGIELFGNSVTRCYLPYDFPFAVQHFLHHFKPAIGLLMETEIWPNLAHACKQQNVPLLLVNARLSEKSAGKYQKFASLTQETLRSFTAIAAQTAEDAARLKALGAAHPSIMGNLKFDATPPTNQLALGQTLHQLFGEIRPIFLAASTREGEENLLLDVLQNYQAPDLLTVIVPRHPQRFDEVAALLNKRGISFQRRSANQAIETSTAVVLGDSMGEMFAYYAASDVAYIGGSLLPFGGQNLIEACATGTPVLIGPHTYNFSLATEEAVSAGAAIRVPDAAALAQSLAQVLQNESLRHTMREAGLKFARQHAGATQRLISLIEQYLG